MEQPEPWNGLERRKEQGVEILNMHRRMDRQDEILAEINEKLTSHLAIEQEVKPSLDELVKVLNGIKFLRATVLIIAPLCALGWNGFLWIKEHIKWS